MDNALKEKPFLKSREHLLEPLLIVKGRLKRLKEKISSQDLRHEIEEEIAILETALDRASSCPQLIEVTIVKLGVESFLIPTASIEETGKKISRNRLSTLLDLPPTTCDCFLSLRTSKGFFDVGVDEIGLTEMGWIRPLPVYLSFIEAFSGLSLHTGYPLLLLNLPYLAKKALAC